MPQNHKIINFVDKSMDVDSLKAAIFQHLMSFQGRDPEMVGNRDIYRAIAFTLRDYLIEDWIKTQKEYYQGRLKRVYYLSLEFLVGRTLGNTLINLGFYDLVAEAVKELGFDLEMVREEEEDAALGNGGLGRLAACMMDSMATLGIPAYGYGIRYDYGLFYQRIIEGHQVESPDDWHRYGSPWEFERPHHLFPVSYYGRVNTYQDGHGNTRYEWVDTELVMAMACDILVPGYQNNHAINMRLWTARASREMDLSFFNRGDYLAAVESKVRSETISKVLYPSDDIREGQELRLKQQYFFVAATFQDIIRRYKKKNASFDCFCDKVAVQLNDTHPAIAIPELMRLLTDVEGLNWEQAWEICTGTFGYTNHTLMPEALETWSVELLGRILPRHLQIIYEINHRFLKEVAARYPGDLDRVRRMSLIDENGGKKVRMAHLAIVGSHSVNGVAELHTQLLRTRIFRDFEEFYAGKITNKTNGITPRRWLLKANPGLARLITETIGENWVTDLEQLRGLEPHADMPKFQKRWRQIKRNNKKKLARLINAVCSVDVSPDSLFDVQVKRIHEYKRQLLNILHAVMLYHAILDDGGQKTVPRTIIFAGKAAPSYWKAKLIIRLINGVAEVVNSDPRVGGMLRVVFIPNYGVSLAEKIIPAADLSEQISTAGTEASGTGNMKFALNGALTIGTLDGANIEIREEVGEENIFIFGMTAAEVESERRRPTRTPQEISQVNPEIARTLEAIRSGVFSKGDPELFKALVDGVLDPGDPYLVLKDLEEYRQCQQRVSRMYLDQRDWCRRSILNVARMGKFSSDRTVRQYARDIWGIEAG